MICARCKNEDTKVLDSRATNEGKAIRRRRECEKCGHRFTTFERAETTNFIVIKKDNSRETYDRDKLESGLWKACEKRQVTEEQIQKLISGLEEEWATTYGREVPSRAIGEGLMEKLKDLDEVAYIRFASVYRHFRDLETFKKEVGKLLD
ncbi:MAG: transcriptional regulator NrdR [Patescibacteria group bacterium]|nr:transcriptional regulator NrdR [Patescibacteria group bacterium]